MKMFKINMTFKKKKKKIIELLPELTPVLLGAV